MDQERCKQITSSRNEVSIEH